MVSLLWNRVKRCKLALKKSHNLSHNGPILSHNLPWKYRTISDFWSHPIRWAAYTNWCLKICIWQLYFSSWSPKGDLRIFLILSPEQAMKHSKGTTSQMCPNPNLNPNPTCWADFSWQVWNNLHFIFLRRTFLFISYKGKS